MRAEQAIGHTDALCTKRSRSSDRWARSDLVETIGTASVESIEALRKLITMEWHCGKVAFFACRRAGRDKNMTLGLTQTSCDHLRYLWVSICIGSCVLYLAIMFVLPSLSATKRSSRLPQIVIRCACYRLVGTVAGDAGSQSGYQC